ncbi:MAG: type IV secretion system DNA-binding domain-containing protein [Candidatus Giovannonibacteria bacterium]|nr:type IV secretion system DNA-binding domain-containing protein [Candidatus Giovannonibacteria bacterium]
MNSFTFFYIILPIVLALILWLLLFSSYQKNKKLRGVSSGLGLALYLISSPEIAKAPQGDEAQALKNFIAQMEQFLSGLATLQRKGLAEQLWGNPSFALEIASHNRGSEIFFYIAFPKMYENLLANQLHGAFPEAKIEKVPDYNIFNVEGATAGSLVLSAESQILPIKTYAKLGADPLGTITSAFSKIKEYGEGAAIQITLRAGGGDIKKRAHAAAKKIKEGASRKDVLGGKGLWGMLIDILSGKMETGKKSSGGKTSAYDEELAKLFEEKAGKIIFECNIRVLASATKGGEADGILKNIGASFLQFNNPEGNGFKIKELSGKALRKLVENFSFRLFDEKNIVNLNVEEIASIYHLPYSKKSAPQVRTLKSRESSPPVNLPKEGLILGKSSFRGEEEAVRMKQDDRRRHFYMIGQTGTGKSALMQNLVVQDIRNGEGIALIDPHGDTIEKVLPLIPKERWEDVIYFDPGDASRPLGLNMLEFDPRYPEQKSLIVNELLEIFNKLFNMSVAGGPMFEQYFRNAAMLVMEDPESGNTLLEIERVLVDKAFRDLKLSKSKNIVVETFWKQIAEKAGGEQSLANMVPYVVSKFDTFLSNEIMRPIIAQEKSAFNIRDVMDQKKILLLNLSKGKLGELNSNLLGLIMVGKILMAALSRGDRPENERQDFYLYIDEFQNVTTKSIATILSEARKYKLNLVITHQFIGQLEEDIKKAVFGNAGSICSFRIGSDDAEYMEKQFAPIFSAQDLLNLDNFNAYLKLLIDGQTSKAFNIKTIPPEAGDKSAAEYIKNLSRAKYGRPREEVEEEIRRRHQALL